MDLARKNSKASSLFDYQHKSDENKWITSGYENFIKCYQPILALLKLTGIKIDLKNDERDLLIYKINRVILIFYSIFTIVLSFYVTVQSIVFQDESRKLNFSVLFNIDQVITLIILIHWLRKGKKVISALKQLAYLLESLTANAASYRSIRRLALVLSLVATTTTCFMCLNVGLRMIWYEKVYGDIEFSEHLFGLQYPEKNFGKVVQLMMGILYAILILCVNLYSSLIVVVSYTIYTCFVNLNKMLVITASGHITLRHFCVFQKKHQEVNGMVQRINDVFSPIVLITVSIKTMKIVMGFKQLKSTIKLSNCNELDVLQNAHLIVTFTVSAFIICILTLTAGKLFTQAQTCFNLLLNISLENPEIYSDTLLNVFKSCHMTTLFSAQRLTTPVGITASDLFTINYNFLFVVISTSVTYFTLLPD